MWNRSSRSETAVWGRGILKFCIWGSFPINDLFFPKHFTYKNQKFLGGFWSFLCVEIESDEHAVVICGPDAHVLCFPFFRVTKQVLHLTHLVSVKVTEWPGRGVIQHAQSFCDHMFVIQSDQKLPERANKVFHWVNGFSQSCFCCWCESWVGYSWLCDVF